MLNQTTLQGQVAVVTGGSKGIGRAVCEKLAQLGADVVVNFSRSREDAVRVVESIQNLGRQAEAIGFDVGNSEEVELGFKQIFERFGRVDILINNAGVARDSLLVRAKNSDWQKTIDVNLSGCFYCSRAVAKSMMKARAGRIINVSSVIGEIGNAGQVAYSASKAGLLGITKSLAKELAGRGVTVNAITPGYIQTEMTAGLPEDVQKAILSQIPLERLGVSEDIANLVGFLASPASSYITGQVIGVNGGMHM